MSKPGPNPNLVRVSAINQEDTADTADTAALKRGIASFYDESSNLWESIWGEHMHHGYYETIQGNEGNENVDESNTSASPPPPRTLTVKQHRDAQVLMIDKVLEWAGVGVGVGPSSGGGGGNVEKVLDVGCGIGGSTRHIVTKYGATYGCGITLSPYQAARATEITAEDEKIPQGSQVEFRVADALNQPFEDESFDLVWSLESGEHMPDKKQFISELDRVLKPGGRLIIVTWCHRVLNENEVRFMLQNKTNDGN